MSTAGEDISGSASTRRLLKRQITRTKEYVMDWSTRTTLTDQPDRLEVCKTELTALGEQFEYSIRLAFNEIDQTKDAAEIQKLEDALFKEQDEVKLIILPLIAKINSIIKSPGRESILNESVSTITAPTPDIRLPKIDIPEFDGDPRKFMKFKSMFQNMIHDEPRLTNVRKLVYLQKALVGIAEEFIRDVDINDASTYPTVWKDFLQRYENKRVIIRTHFTDLFAIKPIKDESGLRKLMDEVLSSLRGLKICGEHPDQWGSILCYLVLTKLDDVTKRDFENSLTDKTKFPSFETLRKFVESRASAVEDRCFSYCSKEKPKTFTKPISDKPGRSEVQKNSFSTGIKCIACNSQHLLLECKTFLAKSPYERFQLIKKNGLCINCFGKNHQTNQCRSRTCKNCNQKHHTMLHMEKPESPSNPPFTTPAQADERSTNQSDSAVVAKKTFATTVDNEVIMLPTAVVRFRCGTIYGKARVLFDPASEATMISDALIRRYHLPTNQSPVISSFSGVGTGPATSTHFCSVTLLSRINQFQLPIVCDVVPPVAIKYEVSVASLNLLKSKADQLQFADETLPYQHTDIILGAKYVEKCYLNETIDVEEATLRKSVFGWLAIGAVPVENVLANVSKFCYSVSYHSTISTIEARVRSMCDSDEFYEPANSKEEHTKCEKHFETTYQRNEIGKFLVRLPREEEENVLSDTRKMAINSLAKIERSSPEIQAEYHKFIAEYERLRHLYFVDADEYQLTNNYFLPQLIVLRPDKSTTRLRTVFHASFKAKNGKSLNDILLAGPMLQLDLFDIIIRFRLHPIAFTADIEKMYRQVLVHPDDHHLQKIYYRSSPTAKLQVGVLQTVTYGTSPASFIATKCLNVLADEIESSNPHCADVIRSDFYMDDLTTGSDTVEEAIQLQQDISNHLLSGHFPLRKYSSNSENFLQTLDPSLIEPLDHKDITIGNFKILGLCWTRNQDTISIALKAESLPPTITKRIMLSEIASIFDVIGILSPVTIRSKLLMQELWREKTSWDSPIPSELEKTFRSYYAELNVLTTFSVPRHYESITKNQPFEIFGFCDASDKAYCAVLYLRAVKPDAKSTFICAKTKVAPLKQPTVPRLELQAAMLLARLINRVVKTFNRVPANIYAFSDSTIVLSWLNKPPSTWKQYVSNRVTAITAILPPECWRYVNTKENPADLATRGISTRQFLSSELWINGPSFMGHDLPPPYNHFESSSEVTKEQKLTTICHTTTVSTECALITNFSSYQQLIYTFAYVKRFGLHAHDPELRTTRLRLLLSPKEISESRTALIYYVQHSFYQNEINALEASKPLPPKSVLTSLSPFLDELNVLRVGGRLRKSDLPYSKKHPIILPSRSYFLKL